MVTLEKLKAAQEAVRAEQAEALQQLAQIGQEALAAAARRQNEALKEALLPAREALSRVAGLTTLREGIAAQWAACWEAERHRSLRLLLPRRQR